MSAAITAVRHVKKSPGVERIYLPGEREHLAAIERRKSGIPIGRGVLAELQEVGARYGLTLEGY